MDDIMRRFLFSNYAQKYFRISLLKNVSVLIIRFYLKKGAKQMKEVFMYNSVNNTTVYRVYAERK